MYEKQHYYAYRTLKQRGFSAYLPHYRRKVNRLLFRLVNYYRPQTLIEVGIGNGASISYMRAACHTMESATLKGRDPDKTQAKLRELLKTMPVVDCLHIGHTPLYKEVFEQAIAHLAPHGFIIIGGIHASKAKKAWWDKISTDERTGITFDLYDVGLVFFDKSRYKQNYSINFL